MNLVELDERLEIRARLQAIVDELDLLDADVDVPRTLAEGLLEDIQAHLDADSKLVELGDLLEPLRGAYVEGACDYIIGRPFHDGNPYSRESAAQWFAAWSFGWRTRSRRSPANAYCESSLRPAGGGVRSGGRNERSRSP